MDLEQDPEYLKYLGFYLTLRRWYSNIVVRKVEDQRVDLDHAEKIFEFLNFIPGIIEVLYTRINTLQGRKLKQQNLITESKKLIDENRYTCLKPWYLMWKKDVFHVIDSTLESEQELLEKASSIAEQLGNPVLKHQMIKRFIGSFQDRQEYELVKSYADQLIEFGEEQELFEFASTGYQMLAAYYGFREEREHMADALEKVSEKLIRAGNDEQEPIITRKQKSWMYRRFGELDSALRLSKERLQEVKKFKERYKLEDFILEIPAWSQLAHTYNALGEYRTAIQYQLKAARLNTRIGDIHGTAHRYANISYHYQNLGELTHAFEYANKALEAYRTCASKAELHALRNLGNIERERGRIEEAINFYNAALEVAEGTASFFKLQIYYELIPSLLIIDQIDQAESLFATMQELEQEHIGRTDIWAAVRLCEALIYKYSKRAFDQVNAAELLREILSKSNIGADVRIRARTHLTEVIFNELKMYNDDTIFEELKINLDMLNEEAQIKFLYPTLIRVLIIKSRIALIDQEYQRSLQLLSQASIMCKEKGMDLLGEKVSQETVKINTEIERWTKFSKTNPTLIERIETSNLQNYFEMAKGILAGLESDP